MRTLVQFEVRCPKHERPDKGCAGCDLTAQLEKEAETIRARRSAYIARVKAAVRDRVIAIVDFK